MTKRNSNPNSLRLQPTNGLVRRVIPALQLAIGEDLADLLCQVDFWARNTPDGWITMSATDMQPTFPTWSIRKIQRTVRRAAALGYLDLASDLRSANRKTPTMRINPFWFTDYAHVIHSEGPYCDFPVRRVIYARYAKL